MPSPIGHAAIGLVVHNAYAKDRISTPSQWKEAVFVSLLATLPDADVLVGLIFQGDGNAFHRGYSHSLLFVLCIAFVASFAFRFWSHIPRITFGKCFAVVLSHVVADSLLTSYKVSFFWPFAGSWTPPTYIGLGDVIEDLFRQTVDDVWIVVGCGVFLAGISLLMNIFRPAAASRQRPERS